MLLKILNSDTDNPMPATISASTTTSQNHVYLLMYVVSTVSKRWSLSSDTADASSCLSRRHCLQPQSRYPSNLNGGGGGGTGGGTGDDSSSESEELVLAPPLYC